MCVGAHCTFQRICPIVYVMFVQKIVAIKFRSRRKPNIFLLNWPQRFGKGRPKLFLRQILARFTVHRLAKFGSVPFTDLRLRNLVMKWNAEFTKGG